jgi:DNA-binding NarL/FixJ family response regulator
MPSRSLVLTRKDWVMPGESDLEISREIARRLPAAAIVLFSFHDLPEMESIAKAAGVHGVASKNLSPEHPARAPLIFVSLQSLCRLRRKSPTPMVLEQHTQNGAGPFLVIADQDSSHISVRLNYQEVSRLFLEKRPYVYCCRSVAQRTLVVFTTKRLATVHDSLFLQLGRHACGLNK